MGRLTERTSGYFLEKSLGADNACDDYFAVGQIEDFPKETIRRAPRVGLLGGRRKRHSIIDRFWARVQKNLNGTDCWIFAGAKWSAGGHISFAREDGSRVAAHRFSYELHHGPIPKGLVVMHSCDVPNCVNPAHLSVGTQRENVHDSMLKGRRPMAADSPLQAIAALPQQAHRLAHPSQLVHTPQYSAAGVSPKGQTV